MHEFEYFIPELTLINFRVRLLSRRELQILVIENVFLLKQRNNVISKRDINDQSILEFKLLLSHENWEEIFIEDDVSIFLINF